MKVSVVMPVYNGGERMRMAIDAVLAQTWRNLEFVCIDDGSTDGISGRILDEYAAKDPRMVVVHRENKGIGPTLNECHARATGDFIAQTDQDDLMHPQSLECCAKIAERYGLDFISFRYKRLAKDGSLPTFKDVLDEVGNVKVWDDERKKSDPRGYCAALCGIHVDGWSQFTRRELAISVPIAKEMCLTRQFKLIRMSRRWARLDGALYFYNRGSQGSLSKRPYTFKEMCQMRTDLRNLFALYEDVMAAGDPIGEWDAICKVYVVNKFKSTLNKIRRGRRRHTVSREDVDGLLAGFAGILREFFVKRGVSLRYARLRHRLAYQWLMFKYRNYVPED
ncbi:MAG: glycosyltransferase family 2 protein [Kiritimatiellae bacterium]|nr:glycosyltransferase family 2 protein [Kiritimatiellia bacterium]